MKKIILSTLISTIGIIGFTLADDINGNLTCPGDYNTCTPVITECGNGSRIGFKINSVPGDGYGIYINDENYVVTSDEYTYLDINECNFSVMTAVPLSINYIIQQEETPTTPIIEDGTEAFSGIITKLGNIFKEFSIYFIYIAVACIGIYIMYGAVKMIIFEIKNNVLYKTRGKREKARRNMKNRRIHKKRENNDKYENDIF